MGLGPTAIWAIDFEDGIPVPCGDSDLTVMPQAGTFRWLHLSLADQINREWIRTADSLPAGLRTMLLGAEEHQRALVEEGYLGCVLHDVERDFDRLDAERTGVLRMALGPSLMVTARHHPLRSADIVRRHVERDRIPVRSAADALDLAVSAIVENIGGVASAQARQIEEFEDELLDHAERFDHRRLIGIRRRVVQFHRLLSGMRNVFKRMEQDADLPALLLPTVEKLAQQLSAIDDEMLSIHSQLRLLREEADLQAAQRTNQNLYVLSILSALLLPATLVTGFFGMNTGGLPFAHSGYGTALAALLGVASSGGVYAMLRAMGLHRS
ncbi:MAG: CorA family divalent cation transporter [Pseudomonadota bacterium]|jgi:zinc transporter|tara:strand:+ start:848 stop:1825 length:978 start_codon:yes stop_codon:yes gene_type:complete